jgi:fermentation-respiration switch protein FrsA (DUF1100 family)
MTSLTPRVPEVSIPVYAVHGLADKTTSLAAVADFVARASSGDKAFRKVKGARRARRGGAPGGHARGRHRGGRRSRLAARGPSGLEGEELASPRPLVCPGT